MHQPHAVGLALVLGCNTASGPGGEPPAVSTVVVPSGGEDAGAVASVDGAAPAQPGPSGGPTNPSPTGAPATGGDRCTNDKDCVPATCCHPAACVHASRAPSCNGVACSADCPSYTLDCGQGHCACQRGRCTAVITAPM